MPQQHDAPAALVPDHPRTRQAARCPLCHNAKDAGLLVCWTCYRAHDMRNGITPAVGRILDNTERDEADNAATPPPTCTTCNRRPAAGTWNGRPTCRTCHGRALDRIAPRVDGKTVSTQHDEPTPPRPPTVTVRVYPLATVLSPRTRRTLDAITNEARRARR